MIHNDQELAITSDRISYFFDLLARLRVSSRPDSRAPGSAAAPVVPAFLVVRQPPPRLQSATWSADGIERP